MKLRCSFDNVAKKANKSKGKDDVNLIEHLKETKQADLPQSDILVNCLDRLVADGLIDEAYLRGSFGRGHGDEHSDIDLFVVAEPENLEKVYDTVKKHLAEVGDVLTDCHDRLVEEYGGIGFMFVAKNDKRDHLYQFDLYVAMKGVPPKNETTISPRIYSKDPSYKWADEYGTTQAKELPLKTKEFIASKTTGDNLDDRMELIMQELLITLFVTNKHIKREQTSRTIVDDLHVVGSAIELLQTLVKYDAVGYTPVYLGNEVVDIARKFGDNDMVKAANKLEKLFVQPMGKEKLRDVLDYSVFVLEKACPEKYLKQKPLIDLFKKDVFEYNNVITFKPIKKHNNNSWRM